MKIKHRRKINDLDNIKLMNRNPFGIVQLTRKQHDGTIEVLVQFKTEKPAWIPLDTLLAIREDSPETVHSEH